MGKRLRAFPPPAALAPDDPQERLGLEAEVRRALEEAVQQERIVLPVDLPAGSPLAVRALRLPWLRQLGPSCGLSALAMVHDAWHAHGPLDDGSCAVRDSLLQAAQAAGHTRDGEVFSTARLHAAALLPCVGCGGVDLCPPFDHAEQLRVAATRAVDAGHVMVIAYDADLRNGHAPMQAGGVHAHWAAIIGYATVETDGVTLPVGCVLQHTLSHRLVAASWDALFRSNGQLHGVDPWKAAAGRWVVDESGPSLAGAVVLHPPPAEGAIGVDSSAKELRCTVTSARPHPTHFTIWMATPTVTDILERIGWPAAIGGLAGGSVADATLPPPSLATLQGLHTSFATTVPFENLDVALVSRRIALDVPRILRKVVWERRGGFCFELNTTFWHLAAGLGFRVHPLSARIWRPAGGFGPVNTHLNLVVDLAEGEGGAGAGDGGVAPTKWHGDQPNLWLCDVGNGNVALCPLRFVDGEVQTAGQGGHAYVLRRSPDGAMRADDTIVGVGGDRPPTWRLFERVPTAAAAAVPGEVVDPTTGVRRCGVVPPPPPSPGEDAAEVCLFEVYLRPVRELAVFADMCAFHQTSPTSPFMRGTVASKPTLTGGRVTIASGMWNGEAVDGGHRDAASPQWVLGKRAVAGAPRVVTPLDGWPALHAALWSEFGIRLPRSHVDSGSG